MNWITSLSLTVKRTVVRLLACSIKMSGSKPKLKVKTLDEMFKKISEPSEVKFEDTKGAIRNRISKKNKHNGQKKVQTDKQRSTKHTYESKDRVTRTPLKPGDELRCSGRVSSSCSTSGTRRVNLVTNPVISREWGKDREVFATSGTYPWSFVTQMFHSGQPSHGGDRKFFRSDNFNFT